MDQLVSSATGNPPSPLSGQSPQVAAEEACPRCGQKLVDPGGLGWCSQCGFCRTLEEDRAKIPLQKPASPATKARGEWGNLIALVGMIPRWAWILVGGMGLMVVATLWPAWYLPRHSFDRAVYCTLQIVLGLFLILAAQFYALLRLAPLDEKLGFKDILLPLRLWGQVFGGLPRLCGALWTAGWGLTLVLAALFLVGGLTYWMKYLPGHQKAGPPSKVPAKMAW